MTYKISLVSFFSFKTGMFAGYMLNRYKSPPAAITPFINIVFWLMSLGVMLLLVFGVWNGTLSLLWTALYVSLGHSGECKWPVSFLRQRLSMECQKY